MLRERNAFWNQKSAARQRGIEFNLDFEQWRLWWQAQLGKDWMSLRGCKRGQYVMGRKNDVGPYSLNNIECILAEDNHKTYNVRRKPSSGWSHPLLNPRLVRVIYFDDRPLKDLSLRYGLSKHKIYCIKRKKTYSKITKNFPDEPSSVSCQMSQFNRRMSQGMKNKTKKS